MPGDLYACVGAPRLGGREETNQQRFAFSGFREQDGVFYAFRPDGQKDFDKTQAAALDEIRAEAEGSHGGPDHGNSDRARTGRLLSRRRKRKMGFEHSRGAREVPVRKRD